MPVHVRLCVTTTTQTHRLSSSNTRKRDVGSRHSLSTSFSATRASMACSTARESSLRFPCRCAAAYHSRFPWGRSVLLPVLCRLGGSSWPSQPAWHSEGVTAKLACLLLAVAVSLSLSLSLTSAIVCLKVAEKGEQQREESRIPRGGNK